MELGFGEIVVIAAIVLLLFGPKKLPQLGDALGRGIRNFKDAMSGREEPETDTSAPALPPPASSVSVPGAAEGEPQHVAPSDKDLPVAR
jgi:sec-independent protein translocase protein TatA